MNTPRLFNAQVKLAKAYLEDGAQRSAARVLRDLAAEIERRADAFDALLDAANGGIKTMPGDVVVVSP